MSLPYTLVEKSVLRKPNSTKTIGTVLTDTTAWMNSLEEGNSVANFFYYAEVIDSDTKNRYFVYSNEAVAYFGLADNIVVADSTSASGTDVTIDASQFSGNLTTTDDTLQKIADKVDDLSVTPVSMGLRYATVGWVNIYPSVGSFAPFMTNFSNATVDTAQKIDDSTFLLKAGRTYKFDGGLENLSRDSGTITLKLATYSNIEGSLDEEYITDGFQYINSGSANYTRNYKAGGYYTAKEDKYLKCEVMYNNLSGASSLTFEITITEFALDSMNLSTMEAPGYSTDEILTERRWIDGKPIYRKVLSPEFTVNGEWSVTPHNISDLEYTTSVNAFRIDNGGNYSPFIYGYMGDNTYSSLVYVYTDNVGILLDDLNGNWDVQSVVVIVEYVKTTDTSSSPVAQIAVQPTDEYSLDETLTNKKWLGEPVYRKVIQTPLSGITGPGWSTLIDYSDLNIKTIVIGDLKVGDTLLGPYAGENSDIYTREWNFEVNGLFGQLGTGYTGTLTAVLEYTKN